MTVLHKKSAQGWPQRATPTNATGIPVMVNAFVGAALRGRPISTLFAQGPS
jgi:hypothetical protein